MKKNVSQGEDLTWITIMTIYVNRNISGKKEKIAWTKMRTPPQTYPVQPKILSSISIVTMRTIH